MASHSIQPQTHELNLQYLENELLWINSIVQKSVLRWEMADQDPTDPFRGMRFSGDEIGTIAGQPLCGSWGTDQPLPEAQEARFFAGEKIVAQRRGALLKQACEQHVRLRLPDLAKALALSGFEYQAFLVCLAPSLDLRFERLYSFLQDDVTRKSPGVNLILNLLLPPGAERFSALDCFRDRSTLLHLGLIKPISSEMVQRPVLSREFIAAPDVVTWILGGYAPAEEIAGSLRLFTPPFKPIPPLDEPAFTAMDWVSACEKHCLVAFSGVDRQRQMFAAQRISEKLGRPLLVVDLPGMKSTGFLEPAWLRLALRDCLLTQAIPFLSGWDTLYGFDAPIQAAVQDELVRFPGLVITSSEMGWNAPNSNIKNQKSIIQWDFGLPSFVERKALWHFFIGKNGRLPEPELELIAGQYMLTSHQIQDAVTDARNLADTQRRHLMVADLLMATRQQATHHLDSLAVKINPRYSWQDIVLPDDEISVLQEIVATIRERPRVLEEWGLGQKLVPNPGIAMLFAGPPGTGKTLAAQVIAAELGMEIYKIDLSTVVSKYIGETEKNLERIFSQAVNSNAILFFDEADAIFGKRSEVKDAHDRYANIEVSYLLQRIESYDGVVILATNLRSNLDEAFIRRLQFIVDFPFPDEAQRLRIWKVLFPPGVPQAGPLNFENLARRFKLSGGNIRNVIVNAAFLAASEGSGVADRHLIHGVRREMQKLGRLIDEKELSL